MIDRNSILALLGLLLAFGIVGRMDYDDAVTTTRTSHQGKLQLVCEEIQAGGPDQNSDMEVEAVTPAPILAGEKNAVHRSERTDERRKL